MSVIESRVNRQSQRCTVSVTFRDGVVQLRPDGQLDATAADLLVELVRAAHQAGVEVSLDLPDREPTTPPLLLGPTGT